MAVSMKLYILVVGFIAVLQSYSPCQGSVKQGVDAGGEGIATPAGDPDLNLWVRVQLPSQPLEIGGTCEDKLLGWGPIVSQRTVSHAEMLEPLKELKEQQLHVGMVAPLGDILRESWGLSLLGNTTRSRYHPLDPAGWLPRGLESILPCIPLIP